MFTRSLGFACFVLALLLPNVLLAQSEVPRVEVGALYTLLKSEQLTPQGGTSNEAGVGGRFTVNLKSWLSTEAEINYFPKSSAPGNRTLGLFGVKAGWRAERFGIFAKARPGILYFSDPRLPAPPFPSVGACFGLRQKNFAMDVGGVVEGYPSRRTVIRVDAGDTITKLERICPYPPFAFPFTTHNPQFNIGFGFRF
ncbi:MAG: hypothetical protein JST84_23655 [Acidobacteria bacterium]|nr:hypothetical protein [Acidobacteriota bacterium]